MKNKENAVALKHIEVDSDVLRKKLVENRKKLEDIALHMVQKNEELSRLKTEIEELGRLYMDGQ